MQFSGISIFVTCSYFYDLLGPLILIKKQDIDYINLDLIQYMSYICPSATPLRKGVLLIIHKI